MLTITSGNLDLLKAEMKTVKQEKEKTAKALQKLYRSRFIPDQTRYKLDDLEKQMFMYSPSKVLPGRVGDIVINIKAFQAFYKKLKNFETELIVNSESLVLKYWKHRSQSKGVFTLYDLSSYFKTFEHIPVAEQADGQEE